MMSWFTWLAVIVVPLMLGTALMHQPGVKLYDWIATRAVEARSTAGPDVHGKKRAPLTQTG